MPFAFNTSGLPLTRDLFWRNFRCKFSAMRLQLTLQAGSVKRRDLSCREAAQFNHALQRTRPSRSGCNPRLPRAGSLSLGRSAARAHQVPGRDLDVRRGDFLTAFLRSSAPIRLARISGSPYWARRARISFRVFRVFRGYIPGAVTRPAAAATLEILAGDF